MELTSRTGAERQQFRHASHPRTPRHMMRVDQAVDAVGAAMFPDTWGKQPAFSQLPFFKKDEGLVRLVPRQNNRYELVAMAELTDEVATVADQFTSAYRMLRAALCTRV